MATPKCVQDKVIKFASPEEAIDGILENKVISPKILMDTIRRELLVNSPSKLRCKPATTKSLPVSPNDEGEYIEDDVAPEMDILREEIQALKDEIANIKLDMLQ